MTASFVLLGVLLILSGFFSGTETAFTSLSAAQVHDLAKRYRKRGVLVERLMSRPEKLLTTVLIGNNLVNVAATAVATVLTITLFGSGFEWLMTAVLTVIILIFGEVTPKRIAIAHNEAWALYTVRTVVALEIIFAPVIWFATMVSNVVSRLATRNVKPDVSSRGLMTMVDHAETVGVIEKDQGQMVRGVLRFGDMTASTVMTHRTRVFSLGKNMTVRDALPAILESGFSRVPVYGDSAEEIEGIVLLHDVVEASVSGHSNEPLRSIMLEPIFVPENRPTDELLAQLRHEKLNLAVVLDEYGGVAGLVTVEDLVEEILGELYDENEERERSKITRENETTFLIRADIPTYVVNDALEVNIPSDRGAQTLGGYIAAVAGHIPAAGETISSEFGRFEIVSTSRRQIVSVRFHRKPRDESDD
jgi:CBS domain containing-hemolysin-like protein